MAALVSKKYCVFVEYSRLRVGSGFQCDHVSKLRQRGRALVDSRSGAKSSTTQRHGTLFSSGFCRVY